MIGSVVALWRYPVKSMLGERLDGARIDARGVVGDRLFAVRDEQGKFGSGKNTRRFRRIDGLFRFTARYDGDRPVITFPDGVARGGDEASVHAALSEVLGQPVTLSREQDIPHHDAGAVHLITTSTLRAMGAAVGGVAVDERRFRPNFVIDTEGAGLVEDGWIGRELRIGDEVRVIVSGRTERCVMVGMPQSELPDDPRVLREAARLNDACVGVYAKVIVGGTVRAGDPVELL